MGQRNLQPDKGAPAGLSCRELYIDPAVDPISVGLPLLGEIEVLGHDRFPTAKRRGLRLHRHKAAFEIHYIVDGHLFWHVNGQSYTLRPGDVFVTPPNTPHGGDDEVMQPCEIYWVQVRFPPAGVALPGLSVEQTQSIQEALSAAGAYPAFASSSAATVESAFAGLIREHRDCRKTANPFAGEREADSLHDAAARAALRTLLIQVVRDAAASARQRESLVLSPALTESLQWMEAHLGESFTLEEVAEAAGLSVATLTERFQRELGTTPAEWRTQKRIERAKTWLMQTPEKRVTEIALMLGFGSSQYFATAFKRYTAHTPSEYREIHGKAL